MNITEQVKLEIIEGFSLNPCCRVAGLSAFIKGAGSLTIIGGNIGFEFLSENKIVFDRICGEILHLYGVSPQITKQGKKFKAEYANESAGRILASLSVIDSVQSGLNITLPIDKYIIENDCCKLSFIKGAFLANGKLTLPDEQSKLGYHLEFIFSNYVYAESFCELLTEYGLNPKTSERSGYIVSFDNVSDILEVLDTLDATKARVAVLDVRRGREYNNKVNREINCTISNINKQVNAFLKQKEAINKIIKTKRLKSLKKELQDVCLARLDNPDSSLEELSLILNVSKSCLSHRLRRIITIANNID